MSSAQAHDISVILKSFEGCNTGNLEDLLGTFDREVVHYFLPEQLKPIRGAQHPARYWRKSEDVLDPIWKIDHIIGQEEQVVSEWSCIWTPEGTDLRLMMRGSEWYALRQDRIVEVRAYLGCSDRLDTELTGFPT